MKVLDRLLSWLLWEEPKGESIVPIWLSLECESILRKQAHKCDSAPVGYRCCE